ncbi:MAG: Nucleoporin nup84 [Thelocarpon impressellum]|nr:MAG: Nucleoporin nup84 [Thelocarpon impressellum]
MAPLTRHASALATGGPSATASAPTSQTEREGSWDFASSESRSDAEEYDESLMFDDDNSVLNADSSVLTTVQPSLLDPDQYEDAIYPLKAAADRVGREVEKFAEQLDRLNPRNHKGGSVDRYNSALELVDEYRSLAGAAVDRLRSKHAPRRQKQVHNRWRQRIESFKGDGAADVPEDSLELHDGGDESGHGRSSSTSTAPTTVDDLKHWEQEEQTWSLFRQLIELQCPKPGPDGNKEKDARLSAVGEINRFTSEDKIWDRFLIEDDLAKERQIVLTWLKNNAESSGKDIDILVEQLEGGADRGKGLWAHGWLHTKEAIKAQKRLRSWPQALIPTSPGLSASLLNSDKTEGLVTQLDPDAVTRQSQVLEKPDQYFERATWLACWEMLRRGRPWSEVREWCKDRVEGWRAVSLRGAIAAWDESVDGVEEEGRRKDAGDDGLLKSQINGNRSRALWRKMCYALAVSGGIDDYERAVYGVLSGELASVEKVCHTWDDFVFAHYNSLLLGQFEAYLQSRYPDRLPVARKFGIFDSAQLHGEPETVGRRIVDGLRLNRLTQGDAQQPMKTLQGVLIGKTFASYVFQQGLVIARDSNLDGRSKIIPAMPDDIDEASGTAYFPEDEYDGIRVLVHMLLTFQDLEVDLGFQTGHGNAEIASENIIVSYIDFLRLSGKLLMIPLYASRLSPERQILTLGRVLLDETASSRRKELMKLMYGLGIDVPQVMNMQLMFLLDDLEYAGLRQTEIEIGILQEMRRSQKPGRQIKRDFIGQEIIDVDSRLIRSFEWFLLMDGHWEMTFKAGELLYRRFLSLGHLAAAKELLGRVPSSLISKAKTGAILGKSLDVSTYTDESEGEEELTQATPRATRSGRSQAEQQARRKAEAERARMKTRTLAKQARTFVQLEELTKALVAMEYWKATTDQLPPQSDPTRARSWRNQLRKATDDVTSAVEPLLHGWLVDVPERDAAYMEALRNAYIPDVVIAYNSVLHYVGHALSRESLLQCMELSTVVAAKDSDILECFIKKGRLPELVTAFAISSKAILKANETRANKGGTRKRAGMGESLTVWNVKP